MSTSLKPLIYVGIGGLVLSLVSLVIWIMVNQAGNEIRFGRVVAIASSTITIADRQDNQVLISVASTTQIMRRREILSLSDVAVNNFVQISLVSTTADPVAQSIHLLKPPRSPFSHEADN